MSAIDELVNKWVKDRFLTSWQYTEEHGKPEEIEVLSADVESYCGCYSEFTRDDGWEMVALLSTKEGAVRYSVGLWGSLPQFIEELAAYKYGETDCPYDEED